MNVWKVKVSAGGVWRHSAGVTCARQFALPFDSETPYAAADYFPSACNAEALAWLEDASKWPSRRLAIYGAEGTGKTHLLHYFAARHHAKLLSGSAVRRFMPLPDGPALGIDDADSVVDGEALLHLLNAAAERGILLLLAGRAAPAHWDFKLPDLVSRLRATAAVALADPDDELLKAVLARLLSDRQMAVPERMQNFLLARLPRTGHALREAAARLDRYSLAEGRAVTPAIAQRVIDEFRELL
jgi:chromosomal replication initiation ATPase DnaA